MHAIKPNPEAQRCTAADPVLQRDANPISSPHADVLLAAAILAPLAILGLLVLAGVGIGVAACIMLGSVFAAATAFDVRWLQRCRRDRNDLREVSVNVENEINQLLDQIKHGRVGRTPAPRWTKKRQAAKTACQRGRI